MFQSFLSDPVFASTITQNKIKPDPKLIIAAIIALVLPADRPAGEVSRASILAKLCLLCWLLYSTSSLIHASTPHNRLHLATRRHARR